MWVYKSVGAVAVYSPARAVALASIGVVAVAGAGFAGGVLVGGGDSSASASASKTVTAPAPEPPRSESAGTKPTAAAPQPDRPTRARAYSRGYVQGVRNAFGSSSDFRPGGVYVIRLERGLRGAPFKVSTSKVVETGRSYFLCAGGTRLCIASG